jgi:hypothetical protein
MSDRQAGICTPGFLENKSNLEKVCIPDVNNKN